MISLQRGQTVSEIFKRITNRVVIAGERRRSGNSLRTVGEPRLDGRLRRQRRMTMNLDSMMVFNDNGG